MPFSRTRLLCAAVLFVSASAMAGEADVLSATARRSATGLYAFEVTIHHDDQGWNHYADRFEILTPQGRLLATRMLLHPHVDEQPFTRSQTDVSIPSHEAQVRIRAHDSAHGYGGRELTLDLPQ